MLDIYIWTLLHYKPYIVADPYFYQLCLKLQLISCKLYVKQYHNYNEFQESKITKIVLTVNNQTA